MRTIIVLAVLGSALAAPDHVSRIVGGNDTTIQTYPFTCNLQYSWFGIIWAHQCGGTLITPNSVLSAAHCSDDYLLSQVRVVLGSTLRSGTGGTFHAVSRIAVHPEYSIATALDADVAILHLAVRAVLSDSIQTVPIASAAADLPVGLPVTVIGWGTLSYQGPQPDILQHVEVYVIDQEFCAERYIYLKTLPGFAGWPDVTDYMVCAGVRHLGGRDGCHGDSGGPVVYRAWNSNIVVGISSWAYRCGDPDFPGVLVRVPKFTDWIVQNA